MPCWGCFGADVALMVQISKKGMGGIAGGGLRVNYTRT